DPVVLGVAKLAVELLVRQRAQRVLVEDRDTTPDPGIVELRRVQLGDSLFPERHEHCPLDGGAFALRLYFRDVFPGFRERHHRFERIPTIFSSSPASRTGARTCGSPSKKV